MKHGLSTRSCAVPPGAREFRVLDASSAQIARESDSGVEELPSRGGHETVEGDLLLLEKTSMRQKSVSNHLDYCNGRSGGCPSGRRPVHAS